MTHNLRYSTKAFQQTGLYIFYILRCCSCYIWTWYCWFTHLFESLKLPVFIPCLVQRKVCVNSVFNRRLHCTTLLLSCIPFSFHFTNIISTMSQWAFLQIHYFLPLGSPENRNFTTQNKCEYTTSVAYLAAIHQPLILADAGRPWFCLPIFPWK